MLTISLILLVIVIRICLYVWRHIRQERFFNRFARMHTEILLEAPVAGQNGIASLIFTLDYMNDTIRDMVVTEVRSKKDLFLARKLHNVIFSRHSVIGKQRRSVDIIFCSETVERNQLLLRTGIILIGYLRTECNNIYRFRTEIPLHSYVAAVAL